MQTSYPAGDATRPDLAKTLASASPASGTATQNRLRAAVWLVIALVALNVVSTLLECGFAASPDNPVSYQLLKSTR